MTREFLPETHAREKAGMTLEWSMYQIESIGPPGGRIAMRLRGAVFPALKSGPRKGQPNYSRPEPGTDREVWLTDAEHDAWKAGWERRTGKCARCVGHGDLPWRASKAGAEMRPCKNCGGSGKAKGGEPR